MIFGLPLIRDIFDSHTCFLYHEGSLKDPKPNDTIIQTNSHNGALLCSWSSSEIYLFLSSWPLFHLDISPKRIESYSDHRCVHLRE